MTHQHQIRNAAGRAHLFLPEIPHPELSPENQNQIIDVIGILLSATWYEGTQYDKIMVSLAGRDRAKKKQLPQKLLRKILT